MPYFLSPFFIIQLSYLYLVMENTVILILVASNTSLHLKNFSNSFMAVLASPSLLEISWLQSPFQLMNEPRNRKSFNSFNFLLVSSKFVQFLSSHYFYLLDGQQFLLHQIKPSLFSASNEVSSTHLKLLIFFQQIFILPFKSNLAIFVICSAYRHNRQGDKIHVCLPTL